MDEPRKITMTDVGLLIIRLGLAISFVCVHGWGKISGGPETWEKIGGAMALLNITFAPTFWGFMAAFAEFFGAILLGLGVLFRPAALLLLCVMIVAANKHLQAGDALGRIAYPAELGFVFLGLLLAGPGKLSLKSAIAPLRKFPLG